MQNDGLKGTGFDTNPAARTKILIHHPIATFFNLINRPLRTTLGAGGLATLVTIADKVVPAKGVQDYMNTRQAGDDLALMHQRTGNHTRLAAMTALLIDDEFSLSHTNY